MNRTEKMNKKYNVKLPRQVHKQMQEMIVLHMVDRLEQRFMTNDFALLLPSLFVDAEKIAAAVERFPLEDICDPRIFADLENFFYREIHSDILKVVNEIMKGKKI